jgi:hypothetical protein
MNKQTMQIVKFGALALGAISVFVSWNIGTYGEQPGLWTPLFLMVVAGLLWCLALLITGAENRARLQQTLPSRWLMITSSSTAMLFAFLLPWVLLFALLRLLGMP